MPQHDRNNISLHIQEVFIYGGAKSIILSGLKFTVVSVKILFFRYAVVQAVSSELF